MPEESVSVDHLLIFYEEKWHYFQAVWHENYQYSKYSIHKFVISLYPLEVLKTTLIQDF